MDNYRQILGLNEYFTLAELKRAYLKLVKENHPDKFKNSGNKELATKKMYKINEAYEYLKNHLPEKKTQKSSAKKSSSADTSPKSNYSYRNNYRYKKANQKEEHISWAGVAVFLLYLAANVYGCIVNNSNLNLYNQQRTNSVNTGVNQHIDKPKHKKVSPKSDDVRSSLLNEAFREHQEYEEPEEPIEPVEPEEYLEPDELVE